jgi:hypothetical protein
MTTILAPCPCGLKVRVEVDEGGAAVELHPCSVDSRLHCEHQLVACADCGLYACEAHRTEYGGTVICFLCRDAEIAEGAELLAEVSA